MYYRERNRVDTVTFKQMTTLDYTI